MANLTIFVTWDNATYFFINEKLYDQIQTNYFLDKYRRFDIHKREQNHYAFRIKPMLVLR